MYGTRLVILSCWLASLNAVISTPTELSERPIIASTSPEKNDALRLMGHAPKFAVQHYTVAEIASLWKLSEDTVRKLFAEEPDVLVIGNLEPRFGKRRLGREDDAPAITEGAFRLAPFIAPRAMACPPRPLAFIKTCGLACVSAGAKIPSSEITSLHRRCSLTLAASR